jgi:glucose 1-dehydrogenase
VSVDHLSENLHGKVAIVAGAASGIGLAITRQLSEYGVSVVAEDIDPAIDNLFASLDTLASLVGDVADEQTAKDAVDLARGRFGKLDILVNNAGTIINRPVVDTTLEDWNHIIGTNATGAFLHTRSDARDDSPPEWLHCQHRFLRLFSNVQDNLCLRRIKGALAQLTRTAALEGIDNGIRVNALGVGDVVTNILGDPDDLVEHGKGAPINRAADPTEIAHVAAFLASDLASFAVGAVWMVDGGMSVAIPN